MKKISTLSLLIFLFSAVHAQWSSNTSTNFAAATVNSSDIVTKTTKSGKTFIAFYSQRGKNYDMRAQLLDSTGKRLFGDSGILVSSLKSGSATFVFNACLDHNGNMIIAFQHERKQKYKIVVYKIDSLGNSLWGTNGKGLTIGNGLGPWPIALSNNNVVVAWQNNKNNIAYQEISNKGVVLWDSNKVIKYGIALARPQIVANYKNYFTIIYQQVAFPPFYTNLYAQRFDGNGNAAWASPVQLSNAVTASYSYYSVLSDVDTCYAGYFANPQGSNRFNGFIQRLNPDGSIPWDINGTEFANYSGANDPYTMRVQIDHRNGMPNIFAIGTMSNTLQSEYGISIQSIDASSGARLFGEHAKTVYNISDSLFQQQGRLTICTGEPFFIFTDVNNMLYATKLDSMGNFAWANRKLALSTTTNQKSRFWLSRLSNSQAVAVWQEDKGNGPLPYVQNVTCDERTGTLPVSLLNFHGIYNAGTANLYWQTNNEQNNAGFEVQRSLDGLSFSKISFVNSLATLGNSTQQLDYAYNDIKIPSGYVYYRLKQTDKDGNFAYSNVILLKSVASSTALIYPNPVTNILNVYFNAPSNVKANFIITDMLGKTVKTETQEIINGNNVIKINCSSLQAGMYFIKVIGDNTLNIPVQKFIKN